MLPQKNWRGLGLRRAIGAVLEFLKRKRQRILLVDIRSIITEWLIVSLENIYKYDPWFGFQLLMPIFLPSEIGRGAMILQLETSI